MKRFFISALSITLCILSVFSLSSCSSKENTFSKLYVENVTREARGGEITSIAVYTDSDGGELAKISVKKQDKKGYYVITNYYMVVSDIIFDAEKIEISDSQSNLYGNDIKANNGGTVKKGYFCAVPELGDINTSKEYGVICIWYLFQAEQSNKEYDIKSLLRN